MCPSIRAVAYRLQAVRPFYSRSSTTSRPMKDGRANNVYGVQQHIIAVRAVDPPGRGQFTRRAVWPGNSGNYLHYIRAEYYTPNTDLNILTQPFLQNGSCSLVESRALKCLNEASALQGSSPQKSAQELFFLSASVPPPRFIRNGEAKPKDHSSTCATVYSHIFLSTAGATAAPYVASVCGRCRSFKGREKESTTFRPNLRAPSVVCDLSGSSVRDCVN